MSRRGAENAEVMSRRGAESAESVSQRRREHGEFVSQRTQRAQRKCKRCEVKMEGNTNQLMLTIDQKLFNKIGEFNASERE